MRVRSGSCAPTPWALLYGGMCTPSSQTSPSITRAIRVGQLHVAEAQALDLAAAQHDAALERVDDRVVVPCPAVAAMEAAMGRSRDREARTAGGHRGYGTGGVVMLARSQMTSSGVAIARR